MLLEANGPKVQLKIKNSSDVQRGGAGMKGNGEKTCYQNEKTASDLEKIEPVPGFLENSKLVCQRSKRFKKRRVAKRTKNPGGCCVFVSRCCGG